MLVVVLVSTVATLRCVAETLEVSERTRTQSARTHTDTQTFMLAENSQHIYAGAAQHTYIINIHVSRIKILTFLVYILLDCDFRAVANYIAAQVFAKNKKICYLDWFHVFICLVLFCFISLLYTYQAIPIVSKA